MSYDPDRHHRQSIRLKGHDYALPGAYFVTICTHQRECLLGHIESNRVVLSEAGQTARLAWDGLPVRFPSVAVDECVIMPNHVHGVVLVGAQFIAPDDPQANRTRCLPTLGELVRAYKATVTRLVRRRQGHMANPAGTEEGVMNHAPTGFGWQRGFYEHIVRNESELAAIRAYIQANPARWDDDENNPAIARP